MSSNRSISSFLYLNSHSIYPGLKGRKAIRVCLRTVKVKKETEILLLETVKISNNYWCRLKKLPEGLPTNHPIQPKQVKVNRIILAANKKNKKAYQHFK